MKKIIQSLTFATLFVLGSCDNLDLAPIDYAATGNYWQNEAQVTTFMNGLHTQLRGDYTSPAILGEFRGGTLRDGTSTMGTSLNYATIVTNALSATNTGITNWNGYYSRLLQVNHFIEQVEGGCEFLNESSRSGLLGQAYGLRAYYYFMLYRTFGGVPLETEVKVMDGNIDVTQLYQERGTAEATLQLIKDDIQRSESAFGSSTTLDRTQWSRYATLMLKAQVYMWSAKVTTADEKEPHTATGATDLQTARTALQAIIDSGKFSLADNFGDLYDYKKKQNDEIILVMPFDRDETTNSGWGDYFIYASTLFAGSFYDIDGNVYDEEPLGLSSSGLLRMEYKEDFVRAFSGNDTRRAATFFEYYTTADPATREMGVSMIKLLGHTDSGTRYYDSDIIMYRYADVILSMAEVENGLGNPCASYINQIRRRAYGANYDAAVTYTEGSYAENEMAILRERDKEFVSEGTRWFDLIRMHDAQGKPLAFSAEANYAGFGESAVPVLQSTEEYKLLWPVNVGVLNGDPLLKQTPGY